MKKLVVLVFVMAMNVSVFAKSDNPITKEEIRTKIVALLGNASVNVSKDVKTTVDLLVNKHGEIVVLDVNSNDQAIKSFVVSKLNYKKVATRLQRNTKIFKMPLQIVK